MLDKARGGVWTVDRDGVLNVATLDATGGGTWQGPVPVGNATLVPGSPVSVFQQSKSVFAAAMVDRDGVLNVATLDATGGGTWQGPVPVGNATLVPGSPVSVFQQSKSVFAAAMVDRDGVLNVATLDATGGGTWQGPVPVGNATLVPGSPVSVFQQSKSVFAAAMVDRDGVLNVATLDTTGGGTWQGPVPVGNATLVPGAPIASVR